LRVHKQVRDYVNSLISTEERNEIIRTSMGLFFGENWWKGKIRLRTTISNAYGQSAIAGPGNEHVLARQMLARALETRNKQRIERFAQIALIYCHKLMSEDRFRDALIAARAIVELLKETPFDKQFVEAAHVYGHALRMTGRHSESVDALREALGRGAGFLIDDFKAKIQENLSLAYKGLDRKEESLGAAREVLKLTHPDSSESF
jgi:tetratricopeptide (TPR) repeat protein